MSNNDKLLVVARRIALPVLLLLAYSVPAWAALPTSTTIEGALLAQGGGPVADGVYNATFSLYKDLNAVAAAWTEGPLAIGVKGGQFVYLLGTSKPIDAATTAALGATPFFGIKIENDPELPRKAVSSVLFAVRASVAESVDCSGCINAGMIDAGVLKPYAKTAELSSVATSGKFSDLSGGPDLGPYAKLANLAAVASSGKYADLVDPPVLVGVATSGKYADLAGSPVLVKLGAKCGSGLVINGFKAL